MNDPNTSRVHNSISHESELIMRYSLLLILPTANETFPDLKCYETYLSNISSAGMKFIGCEQVFCITDPCVDPLLMTLMIKGCQALIVEQTNTLSRRISGISSAAARYTQ
jgi:hypothetical protein